MFLIRIPTIVVAPVHYAGQVLNKIPKRIRIVHFWARTRLVQRSFMVFMVSWIAFIAYNSDALENFFQIETNVSFIEYRDICKLPLFNI